MKSVIIAAALLAASAGVAAAQNAPKFKEYVPYNPAIHKYLERRHPVCQTKAQRLADYERDIAKRVQLTSADERTIRRLKVDLDSGCGGFRLGGRS